jgi:steroid delta-isomerase-like uncharacterized protein
MTSTSVSNAPAATSIADSLRKLTPRWLPHAEDLERFFDRWARAWDSHSLDELDALITDDITWEDPAMHGATVHGRAEFRAFTETFFRAFPDVAFESIGMPYLDFDGTGLGVRWRMTGTFTGPLEIWSKNFAGEPPTIAPTGERFEIEGIDLYELHDGLVSDYTILYDLTALSQQLGLLS